MTTVYLLTCTTFTVKFFFCISSVISCPSYSVLFFFWRDATTHFCCCIIVAIVVIVVIHNPLASTYLTSALFFAQTSTIKLFSIHFSGVILSLSYLLLNLYNDMALLSLLLLLLVVKSMSPMQHIFHQVIFVIL